MPGRPVEEGVSTLLVQLCKAHRHCVSAALAELGLYMGQDTILMQLWVEDGLNQSQLVGGCGVEAPTVTKVLQRMERAGLIERRRDPKDARISRVYLTQRGKSLRRPVYQRWKEIEERMLAVLTLAERLLLHRLLTDMRNSLSAGAEP